MMKGKGESVDQNDILSQSINIVMYDSSVAAFGTVVLVMTQWHISLWYHRNYRPTFVILWEIASDCLRAEVPGMAIYRSLIAKWLQQASQWRKMYRHDLEVMSLSPGQVELRLRSTSVLSCTWTINILSHYFQQLLILCVVILTPVVIDIRLHNVLRYGIRLKHECNQFYHWSGERTIEWQQRCPEGVKRVRHFHITVMHSPSDLNDASRYKIGIM